MPVSGSDVRFWEQTRFKADEVRLLPNHPNRKWTRNNGIFQILRSAVSFLRSGHNTSDEVT